MRHDETIVPAVLPAAGRADAWRTRLFATAVACLLTHELDAVANREWRVLPLTAWMPDEVGYAVFLLAHIPLIIGLLLAGWHRDQRIAGWTRWGVSWFCIVHVGLHALYRGHPEYRFAGWLAHAPIIGAAAAGAAWLALAGRRRADSPQAGVSSS